MKLSFSFKEATEVNGAAAREVSQQYSVGYYPANTARDGKWRNIQLKVGEAGKQSYRARAGYYAPKGDDSKPE
jgi:hypothetical protein